MDYEIDKTGVHLAHCYQGEQWGWCKYGDEDCPAKVLNQVQVKQGRFVINSVSCVMEREDFAAWYVDCKSKYPQIAGDQGNIIYVEPLRVADDLADVTEDTEIILPERYKDWMITYVTDPYEIHIAAYRFTPAEQWVTVYRREAASE